MKFYVNTHNTNDSSISAIVFQWLNCSAQPKLRLCSINWVSIIKHILLIRAYYPRLHFVYLAAHMPQFKRGVRTKRYHWIWFFTKIFSMLQVPPIDYLRQVTLDLGGATGTSADSLPGNSSARSSVATLIKRFNEVCSLIII